MNTELILDLAFLVFSITFALFFVIIGIAIGIAWIVSKNNKKKYKVAVIKIISAAKKKKDSEVLASMKSEYVAYRGSSFSYLGCLQLNCELISELRSTKYKLYYKEELKNSGSVADVIERINAIWNDELTFSDEKINNTFDQIINLSHDSVTKEKAISIVSDLKNEITAFNSFCNGRIFEMNGKISDMEFRMKKHNIKTFFAWLGWIVGFVSGVVTIFHL